MMHIIINYIIVSILYYKYIFMYRHIVMRSGGGKKILDKLYINLE
jgi:hypothetical protein